MSLNRENMKKMCDFLDKLPPENFYLGEVIQKYDEKACASVACAIGWTPRIFPEIVKWGDMTESYLLFVNEDTAEEYDFDPEYDDVANELFGISVGGRLFGLLSQAVIHPRLESLPADVKPKEVSDMLRQFVKLVDDGLLDENGIRIR